MNSLIGSTSSITTALMLYPFEYARVILSNKLENDRSGIFKCVKDTIIKQGIGGIYHGASIALIGTLIFRGTYFGIFDSLKFKFDSIVEKWMASYLSMMTAIIFAYPVDTVRRRSITGGSKYDGLWDCCKLIWKRQKMAGYFLGWRIIPAQSFTSATLLFAYDLLFSNYDKGVV